MYLFLFVFLVVSLRSGIASNVELCVLGQLACDTGEECVQSENWCDGRTNCQDGSDELYCKEAGFFSYDPNKCKKTHFLCNDGMCVPKSAECNGYKDCENWDDEENCDETTTVLQTTSKPEVNVITEKVEEESSDESSSSSSEESASSPAILFDNDDTTAVPTATSKENGESTQSTTSSWSTQGFNFYNQRMKEAVNGQKSVTEKSSVPPFLSPTTRKSFNVAIQQVSQHNYHISPLAYSTPAIDRNIPTPKPRLSTHNSYPRTHYRPPSHQIHPSSYDHRTQMYNPPSYHRSPNYNLQSHGRDSQIYNRPLTNTNQHPDSNNRIHNYNNQRYYDHPQRIHENYPQTYDQSIFVNRNQHNIRHSHHSHNHHRNTLNGEPDWREAAILKPYKRETEISKPFHFAKNYANLYQRENDQYLRDAENWLMRIRRDNGDWGKDTPRALIALGLAKNSFIGGNNDNELMKRNFMVQLGIDLLKNDTESFNINRMASAMNALLSVCENPRDFHGMDLSESLRVQIREKVRKRHHINPFVYLSLCLSGRNITSSELQHLMKQMRPSSPLHEIAKDTQSMAIQTFGCYMQQQHIKGDHAYHMSLQETLNDAVKNVIERMGDDGSFGSVYSTALTAQALISVNHSESWDSEKTMEFLKSKQQENGSFEDFLATYYVIPVLSGRSLLHLRNIHCNQTTTARDLTPNEILEYAGPKQYIHYSIYFGDPVENSHTIRVLVPHGINFYDVMRVAEYKDENFKFIHEENGKKIHVYSLSGLPNDMEMGYAWHLYKKQESDPRQQSLNVAERYTGDLREFLPTSNQHIIFWYHATEM